MPLDTFNSVRDSPLQDRHGVNRQGKLIHLENWDNRTSAGLAYGRIAGDMRREYLLV